MSFLGAFAVDKGEAMAFTYEGKFIERFEFDQIAYDSESWGREPVILLCGYIMTDMFSKPGQPKQTAVRYDATKIVNPRRVR